ncbi:MAG: Nucleotidyltransferase domain protein [Candidatus Argoarchaeum ethanivorans]|uniref:protein adenylyltransferase n=1 Tax=Candidatus Argoarchaeum ethanivorans TaxID=2608793 RepID=A0A811T678_9EURY|nr:MAG: Nucleotidyltransferase domain protein [Candidatus Argoarchaeum ethanivorans]
MATTYNVSYLRTKFSDKIKRILKKHESELREKCGIKEIGVFGSYMRGKEKKGSDIDILVEFYPDAGMDLITFVELEKYLSDLLGVKVDLVMKSALKPQIGKHILKGAVYI